MYSHERHLQLDGLQDLRRVRERHAVSALQRVRAALDELRMKLRDTERAMASLESERIELFESRRGMTHRGGLFTLRRHASELEMRRIGLALTRAQLELDIATAVEEESCARATAVSVARQRDKLEHVSHLWQRESHIRMQRYEDDAA
ncbi:MAG: hypothetical protein WC590_12800 [Burkholderiaceae bacterium]